MIADLELIPARPLLAAGRTTTIPLRAGDRALVQVGDDVEPGRAVVERLRDAQLEEATVGTADGHTGGRWTGDASGSLRRRVHVEDAELLAPHPSAPGRWRIATAEHRDVVESPVRGRVVTVRPGVGIDVAIAGAVLRGVLAAGTMAHGRLELATDRGGEVRSGALDVGRAGTILVVGARIDAEALTRARAMGVRGVVVASLTGKDLRDFLASERRQRAGIHPAKPFGVLVLEGILRRPIPASTMLLLDALAGRDVALLTDPPGLAFDAPEVPMPQRDPRLVRVRHGVHAGREGTFLGLAGSRRFDAGVHLEAAWVRLDDGNTVALPLADLERPA